VSGFRESRKPATGEDDPAVVTLHERRERARDAHLDLTVTGERPRFAHEQPVCSSSRRPSSSRLAYSTTVMARKLGGTACGEAHGSPGARGKQGGEQHGSQALQEKTWLSVRSLRPS
jgi:hypothetical protein